MSTDVVGTDESGKKAGGNDRKWYYIGIGLAALFWILDSLVDYYIFHEGTFSQQLFAPKPYEIWIRVIVAAILLSFGIYARTNVIKHRKEGDAIRRYSRKLEEINHIKDLFTDVLRHDLLNRASVIKMSAENLLEEDPDKPELKLLKKSGDDIIELIEGATKLSKVESVDDLETTTLDLKKVIDEVVENYRPLLEKRDMDVENKIEGPISIKANPVIEEVFTNILTNAIKYAADGEKVVIESLEEDEGYRIMVKDHGPGISDDFKEEVFERFQRRTISGVKGSGLGLAIVKRIIELHKGRVWVEDNTPQGTIFHVQLPKK